MSVKASVSISQQQDAFARKLVKQGRYASLGAVVQRGLDLLREEIKARELERAALRALMENRVDGDVLTSTEGRANTEAMLAAKRRVHGLRGREAALQRLRP